jgi:hypothetical protein
MQNTLAQRLGVNCHVSVLRFKLQRLAKKYPSRCSAGLEDWLVDVANARGARVIVPSVAIHNFYPPPEVELSNEELAVAICQPQGLDNPQILRLAAQLISAQSVNVEKLRQVAERERVERILAELARQALRAEPAHATWRAILRFFGDEPPFREPLLHWTRLAVPVMGPGGVNTSRWRLVA